MKRIDKIKDIFKDYSTYQFPKGTILVRPMEEISQVYFLESGEIRMYAISEEGQEATIHIFKSGLLIPMMVIISEIENTYYFESLTTIKVKKIPLNTILSLIKKDPELLYFLTKNFAQGLMGLSKRIETLLFLKSGGQVASLFLHLAKRFGEKKENTIIIPFKLTHNDIATWLGIARETVSRHVQVLYENNIIRFENNKIEIVNLRMLQKAAR